MRPHRGGDADAADREAGEPDQDQEGAEPVDEAADPRRPGAAVAPLQAALAEPRHRVVAERREVGGGVEAQAVGEVEERAGRQEPARGEVGVPDDHQRPEADAAGDGVGRGGQDVGEDEILGAEADPGAGGEAETVGERLLRHEPGQAVLRRQGVGEAAAGGEPDAAVERVEAVDGLDLHEAARRLAAVGRGHGDQRAEVDDLRDRGGVGVHPGALLRVGEAVGELDLGVAAEERRRLPGEAVLDGGADRADGGDRGDAERQAGEEDAKAGEAAAQLAKRQAGGDRQPHCGILCPGAGSPLGSAP